MSHVTVSQKKFQNPKNSEKIADFWYTKRFYVKYVILKISPDFDKYTV